jgi:hypothetical protein
MQNTEDRDRALSAALRALAEDDRAAGASAAVEARLLAEVRSIGTARRRPRSSIFLAIAAALVLAVALPVWQLGTHRLPAQRAAEPARTWEREIATAFLPLAYSSVPVTNAQIVRMQVPRSALASFGLAPRGTSDPAMVLADVLVGEDGLARAVRFVRPVPSQEQKQ